MRRFLLDYAIPFALCAVIAPFVEHPFVFLFGAFLVMLAIDLSASAVRRLSIAYRREGR